MFTHQSINSALRQFIRGDLFHILALGIVSLAALLIGMNVGYFVVIWIEWGAILGGLALAGSVLLFPSTGRRLQVLRVMFFVAGLALAGAGVSDLLNFPESNSDVYPGLLIGIACGLALASVIWGAGLGITSCRIYTLDPNGAFVSLLLALLGIAMFVLVALINQYGSAYPYATGVVGSICAIVIQIYHLKRRWARLTLGAVWITFTGMLLFSLPVLIKTTSELSISTEANVSLVIVFLVGISLVVWRFVRGSRSAWIPLKLAAVARQLLTVVCVGVVLFPLVYFYMQALDNLENNASPTFLMASDKTFFKLGDEAFIRLMMRDIYYWQPKQGVLMSQKDTPETFFGKLATDPWSNALTIDENNDWENGVKYGRGIQLADRIGKFIIAYIHHNSPAARAGYERGDQIIHRNKYEKDGQKKQEFIMKLSGEAVPYTLNPERYKVDTVIHKVIKQDGRNIGYLWLLNFSNVTPYLIQEAFIEFKKQGVEELILDLRYNGGGHTATLLVGLIAGTKNYGKVYYRQNYSEKYRDSNDDIFINLEYYSIPIKRLFVLTTHDTCSASEFVINGLRPYLPVITIGEKTCGKPFFMEQISYGGNVYKPVTGRFSNAEGKGDYEGGIDPDCKVQEDYSHPVGKTGDNLLDAALYFQKHNACPAK